MKLRVLIMGFVLAQPWVMQAGAQESAADIEVQGTDILRTCREIHRAPQVQDPGAVVTAQGITFNCRLVNANGSTLAQVSPEEVCERLTGSREWYRGAGTQVFCNADGVKTRAVQLPCPQPSDEQIVAEDVSRACQKVHRTGNAAAEPLRITANGPEFLCRLTNSAGFTIAGVSPEQVCEVKTGRRQWCFTETTSYCRGSDYVEPVNPKPGPNPVLIPNPKPGPKPKPGGEAPKPGELKAEDFEFCKPTAPGGDVPVRIVSFRKKRAGHTVDLNPALVACGPGEGTEPATLCQSITGKSEWYVSANGFETKNGLLWPNFIAVCRGDGPRERIAHADIARACEARGWPLANTGVLGKSPPVCADGRGKFQPIAAADVCREQYGSSANKTIGPLYWCLP